jgi:hypothetical protein
MGSTFSWCDVHEGNASVVASLMVTVSSLGGRKDRVQMFTKTIKICRKCAKGQKMSRMLLARTRATLKELLHEQWGKGAEREAEQRFIRSKAGANTGASLLDL